MIKKRRIYSFLQCVLVSLVLLTSIAYAQSLTLATESQSGDKAAVKSAKKPVFKSLADDSDDANTANSANASNVTGGQQAGDIRDSGDEAKGIQVQGSVRIVRGSPETDVFLNGVSERIVIPVNAKHNEIMDECVNSMKTGKSLSFTIDPVSREIRSIGTSKNKSSVSH